MRYRGTVYTAEPNLIAWSPNLSVMASHIPNDDNSVRFFMLNMYKLRLLRIEIRSSPWLHDICLLP